MPNANYVHTITLYNCLRAADSVDKKDQWYRHVLNDCYYKAAVMRAESGTSASQQNTYIARIPQSEQYRPYAVWTSLPEVEKGQCFTMNLDDIVVAGECSDEITGAAGQAAVQLLKRHKPDSFKVTAVSDNTKALYAKHYRLGG